MKKYEGRRAQENNLFPFPVYDDLPITIRDEEYMKAQVQRIIDMRVNPIEGFTSNFDYKKNEWKNYDYENKRWK